MPPETPSSMVRRPLFVVALSLAFSLGACNGAELREPCDDEGRVGGDCATGLLCTRQNADHTGGLVCLQPCEAETNCAPDEICSGERGLTLKACRPR